MKKEKSNITIDLGNNNTILTQGLSNMLTAPSVIALESKTQSCRGVGRAALDMEGKVNGKLKIVRPLKTGVIADLDAASKMLKELIKTLYPEKSFLTSYNEIIAAVPYGTTEVERRALRVAIGQFKARRNWLIYEPLAAAIGMQLDVSEPEGKFIIDIGGGLTEIALISLSGIVSYTALRVGGDSFNADIKQYMERHHLITISDKTAEDLKLNMGTVSLSVAPPHESYIIVGKDHLTGIPKRVEIHYRELVAAFSQSASKIVEAVIRTLEICPPELSGDIYYQGVYLTGGGALLRGLREILENNIKLEVHLDEDPLSTVSRGMRIALASSKAYKGMFFK
ncbi:Rod shape-determining protein MreB [Fulvivirga imtechensis AK7]|uniref:Cell shape-determining protein MreB n=1 Tax=Fulvivirga imtechensis AK7 TaxID=1237149 RepID=L8JH63_9BACT|nr:rod shape-determining protein [Fulvivirga imtechensis]ELR68201.1 Rod shape-determining protein MreB [Fulvivirga imtechensis AK7]